MFLILGLVLLVLWVSCFFVFHVTGFFLYILLILAILSFVFQFIPGRQ